MAKALIVLLGSLLLVSASDSAARAGEERGAALPERGRLGPAISDAGRARLAGGGTPIPAGADVAASPSMLPDPAAPAAADRLVNDNSGATGTAYFTQSEAAVWASGSKVLVVFVDSGSYPATLNHFTGYAYSTDGGASFTDGGTLPASADGDVGYPSLSRNDTTGRIFLTTFSLGGSNVIKLWYSDNDGVTWSAPVVATPGIGSADTPWHAIDNFAGTGNGNLYVAARDYGAASGIVFFRSTDGGATFGPSGGSLIATDDEGPRVVVGPDHAVYVFWFASSPSGPPHSLQMRKSTDLGLTFGGPVTVASGLNPPGSFNGDLGLTGVRSGTGSPAPFRTQSFPHPAVNPVSGHLYVAFNDNPPTTDRSDVYLVRSTDGGMTWSPRERVNDDLSFADQWNPSVAVTPDGTKLGVFYYSRQDDAFANNLYGFYGRVATISGGTPVFGTSFFVSDVLSLPEFGRDPIVNSVYMGDYDQATATNAAFHVVWADNRSGLPGSATLKDPNVYYERIPTGRFTVTAAREKLDPTVTGSTGAPAGERGAARAPAFRLMPGSPNPFSGSTEIAFELPSATESAELAIFDAAGRKVKVLLEGAQPAGRRAVVWDGTDASGARVGTGVYFSRLRAGEFEATQRLVPLR